ncbi:N-acetylglucosamine-6-phosphate deacetylase [Novosphingobium sp.]|uniref:N-acetylglucosamine-6-phosphate deacetylase n=1 Tax=Novosphingobium sp. TaxID=1874826 RepID=UPI0025DDA731|nr:N-acetylglucosamine-6-phosphate deacetylase [Novosphingobium sp.]MCC6925265.1 N-acetylglucosamine-6-phosphate deacetylase [Novosphingobium sp.]
MIDTLFHGGPILQGERMAEGLALAVANGRITWIGPVADAPAAARRVDLAGRMLLPGFIDVQVNGGGGVLFNDSQDTATLRTIVAAHARFGTTGLLPTLISDRIEVFDAGIQAVEAAIAAGVPGVLGIHLEGPYLSEARRGIHPAEQLARPGPEAASRLTALRGGKTLITLAPEVTGTDFVRELGAAGALVSLGHTEADAMQIQAALTAGARGFTHLFNAMPALLNRSPGPVGAALNDRNAWCGLIVDGFHVDPLVLRIALACRPLDRFLLVTDAMALVGDADGTFAFNGETITVEQGCPRSPDGVLAGSALDMASAVRNSIDQLGLSLPQAVAMASSAPAAFLGLEDQLGQLAPGLRANLVVARAGLAIDQTWIDGNPAFLGDESELVL